MSGLGRHDGDYEADSGITGEACDTQVDFAKTNGRQERVPVGWHCHGRGSSLFVPTYGPHTNRPRSIVQVAREPGMVGAGSERHIGSSTGDGMGVGGYIGSSRSCDERRARCDTDREGC